MGNIKHSETSICELQLTRLFRYFCLYIYIYQFHKEILIYFSNLCNDLNYVYNNRNYAYYQISSFNSIRIFVFFRKINDCVKEEDSLHLTRVFSCILNIFKYLNYSLCIT